MTSLCHRLLNLRDQGLTRNVFLPDVTSCLGGNLRFVASFFSLLQSALLKRRAARMRVRDLYARSLVVFCALSWRRVHSTRYPRAFWAHSISFTLPNSLTCNMRALRGAEKHNQRSPPSPIFVYQATVSSRRAAHVDMFRCRAHGWGKRRLKKEKG